MNDRSVQVEPHGEMWEVIGFEDGLDVLHGYYPSYDEAWEVAESWVGDQDFRMEDAPEPAPSLSNHVIDPHLLSDIVYGLIEVTNRIDRQVQAIEGLTRALGGLLLRPEKEGVEHEQTSVAE